MCVKKQLACGGNWVQSRWGPSETHSPHEDTRVFFHQLSPLTGCCQSIDSLELSADSLCGQIKFLTSEKALGQRGEGD